MWNDKLPVTEHFHLYRLIDNKVLRARCAYTKGMCMCFVCLLVREQITPASLQHSSGTSSVTVASTASAATVDPMATSLHGMTALSPMQMASSPLNKDAATSRLFNFSVDSNGAVDDLFHDYQYELLLKLPFSTVTISTLNRCARATDQLATDTRRASMYIGYQIV